MTRKSQRGVKRSYDTVTSDDHTIMSKPFSSVSSSKLVQHSVLRADFFVSDSSKSQVVVIKSSLPTTNTVPSTENSSALPEGFFDNPELDARMRKVEHVDKMAVEWDVFTREMKQETNISDKLEANDDIERDVEREIKETDELITRWQKIQEMHDIKDTRFKTVKEKSKTSIHPTQNERDGDDEDLEKELQIIYNWRQKRS